MAEKSAKMSAERDAAYNKAESEYQRKRDELTSKIESLERSNDGGKNNSRISELTSERSRLPLPQR